MNIALFIIFSLALQAACLLVGGRSSKGLKDQEDYFLASKAIRFFPLMMTFIATVVGGGLVLGAAEEAYQFGWAVLFYPLGGALGLALLGCGLGRRLAQFKISTVAQIFEVAYSSATLKKIASLLSIISLFMVLVAQIIASNKFMLSLGLGSTLGFIAFWGIVILYTSVGGLRAVVNTDIIQASFFVVVFIFCFAFAIFSAEQPIAPLMATENVAQEFSFAGSKLFGWLVMPFLVMIIGQDMGQRCFAANSPATVSKATLGAATCTMIVCIIPLFFGVLAKNMGLEIPPGSSVLMAAISASTTPAIAALMGCAILAAIISTADSLINAIGSNLSQDFSLKLIKTNKIRSSQMLSAVISISAIIFSFYFNNIVDLLIQSYELSISCLFVPVLFALFRKKGNATSAALAMAFGAAGFVTLRFMPNILPRELLSILLSMAGYGLGELLAILPAKQISREVPSYE